MRTLGLVAGSIGLLVVAYTADRWIQEISMNIGIYGGADGWRELGMTASLLIRLLVLAGLAAMFVALRDGTERSGSWALVAIGALAGLLPPVLLGLHFALQPGGLPFIYLTTETVPLWVPTGVFLLWTAIGLLVIGLAGVLATPGKAIGVAVPAAGLAIGAALLIMAAYPVDRLVGALFIELASGLDTYPAVLVVSLAMRIGVMAGFVLLLSSVLANRPTLTVAAPLLAVGVVGFLVLPAVGLLAPPFPRPGEEFLAAGLDPGTAGRWMAGGTLLVGAMAVWRFSREAMPRATIAQDPEVA